MGASEFNASSNPVWTSISFMGEILLACEKYLPEISAYMVSQLAQNFAQTTIYRTLFYPFVLHVLIVAYVYIKFHSQHLLMQLSVKKPMKLGIFWNQRM